MKVYRVEVEITRDGVRTTHTHDVSAGSVYLAGRQARIDLIGTDPKCNPIPLTITEVKAPHGWTHVEA